MASALEPGMWVECADAANMRLFGIIPAALSSLLRKGALYRVSDAWREKTPVGWHDVVSLVGMRSFRIYAERRFRPIYRPNASIIEALKQPLPDLVDA